MHNVVNFYIRQVFTALINEGRLHPLQEEVLTTIYHNLDAMNEQQMLAYQRRLAKENAKPVDEREKLSCNIFQAPTKENPYINYSFLNRLFHTIKQPDYLALPIQSSQWVMKTVFQNWKGFYASLKDYRLHPEKYKARPGIPKYCRSLEKEVIFTNQDCVIKDQKYLKFPKTKERLNIGKLGMANGKLMQVRVIPKYGHYVVELIVKADQLPTKLPMTGRFMALDLGINNLISGVTNTGTRPFLIKGKHVKSINHYYNKQKAHYLGVLRHGKTTNEGPFTSRRLERLHQVRYKRLKDIFHKASHQVVNLAMEEMVDTIIIGQNKGWKQETGMGKRNNQAFVSIPHAMLISMITYKAKKHGIRVVTTEESYTSKASFIDGDAIPIFGEANEQRPAFTGSRIKRGLYRTAKGLFVNADVNGAANILKKAVGLLQVNQPFSFHHVNVWNPKVI
ncbi:RNA-guided endonuclease InsQ/TnpB family protein [Virgibacillus litoralis]|uniref:Transposase n=1 Tax=Virgibacillus litoralis TaxID=578221 RepID=A0ABS4HCL4_9BACI|nr:RNA-guided endonuclease TnpB family protein [Virgibacillus litoralis]MBP1948654.1 putative transposase [Virgibacillus litoralis]